MCREFFDWDATSLQGKMPKLPGDLPRGLLTPPDRVRELVERERAKYPAAVGAGWDERLLNEWTLGYYFDYLGYEVLYRQTPDGPIVLAVGSDEVIPMKKRLYPQEWQGIKMYTG